ncbi:kinase-like protein [Aspergillus sclerotioniger CBS 115572]|uniref:Kinase-like protein n=1 Tax=Aspergillus sclerotioniger CBS 115572 TaxID=1450535 RepID=A0A317X6P9_9EURO|nr:kinase-like protein [Aspergillus sclerotioniger CBS 115572]PWY93227.1 kinase-like protein [Aspergillus sclerotioniger CBS 115572]
MASILNLSQKLKGKTGLYTITKQIQDTVWLATAQNKDVTIVKSVGHFRLQNERDILLQFQSQSPYIRPLLDEIEDRQGPPALILRHLDDDLLCASNSRRLSRLEVEYVAKSVLNALAVLHREGFVHTDIKPSNILVNYQQSEVRFSDVQLADFGSTVHIDSPYARDGDEIGTPIFRSPEAQLQMRWGTATDIWSFGATLISLLYGDGFHIFKPDVPVDHDEYDIKILRKHHACFGPYPTSYQEIADQERLAALGWIMQSTPPGALKPFHLTTSREICQEDKEFVLEIMKLDPRDRPTADALMRDTWFGQDEGGP